MSKSVHVHPWINASTGPLAGEGVTVRTHQKENRKVLTGFLHYTFPLNHFHDHRSPVLSSHSQCFLNHGLGPKLDRWHVFCGSPHGSQLPRGETGCVLGGLKTIKNTYSMPAKVQLFFITAADVLNCFLTIWQSGLPNLSSFLMNRLEPFHFVRTILSVQCS